MFKESDIRPIHLMEEQAKRLAADIERLLKYQFDFVTVTCPACASTDNSKVYQKYGIQFVVCQGCCI